MAVCECLVLMEHNTVCPCCCICFIEEVVIDLGAFVCFSKLLFHYSRCIDNIEIRLFLAICNVLSLDSEENSDYYLIKIFEMF